MPFEEQLPEWNAAGVEPPASKKNTGWQAGEKPPADYWNWQMNRTYKALEELQQKAAEIADLNAHTSATTGVHGATSTATPNTIVQRDAQGRIKAAAPAAADDVARKAEVDSKLPLSGGTLTGPLTMTAQNSNPNAYSQPIYMKYVDSGGTERSAYLQTHPNGKLIFRDGVNDGERTFWHDGNNPANLAVRGYQKFASGLILQWGYDTITSGSTTFTLPIAYPTAHLATIPVAESSDPDLNVTAGNFTITQFTAWANSTNPVPIRWISVGV